MTIDTEFNVTDWVYGYTNGEVYSGEIERIEASDDGTSTIKYKLSTRTELVEEADLAISKAALITEMEAREDARNTATQSALTTAINALATS